MRATCVGGIHPGRGVAQKRKGEESGSKGVGKETDPLCLEAEGQDPLILGRVHFAW